MKLPFPGRRSKDSTTTPASAGTGVARAGRSRGTRRRRFVGTVLLFGLLAAFTSPGRRLVRAFARWVDRHAGGFTEPESFAYSRLVAPLLGGLYRTATDDVAAELQGYPKGQPPTIVDIGCGTGELALSISRRLRDARIVGVDTSPSMLLFASRHATTDGRLRFIVGDGAKMPFPDGSIDLVVSTLSLHHLADPTAVMTEIDRVLRPGGCAFMYDVGMLTLTRGEMEKTVAAAGIPEETIDLERVHGSLLSRLFVRFRFDPDI